MRMRVISVVASVLSLLAASLGFAAPSAQAANPSKCVRDAPATICYIVHPAKSKGWVRVGSYVLPKSKTATTSTCSVSRTSSTKYSLSVSVSAEIKAWVFAKASATVTGGLEKTTTIQAGVSRSFKQPAGTTYRCEWGYTKYQSTVERRVTAGGSTHTTNFVFTGPTEMALKVTKI